MEKVREEEKSGTVEVKGGKRFNTSSVSCFRKFMTTLKSSQWIWQS